MGGRTNAVKLYYRCPPEAKVQYVDFTSLYPSVQREGGAYPLGHPTIVNGVRECRRCLGVFWSAQGQGFTSPEFVLSGSGDALEW